MEATVQKMHAAVLSSFLDILVPTYTFVGSSFNVVCFIHGVCCLHVVENASFGKSFSAVPQTASRPKLLATGRRNPPACRRGSSAQLPRSIVRWASGTRASSRASCQFPVLASVAAADLWSQHAARCPTAIVDLQVH